MLKRCFHLCLFAFALVLVGFIVLINQLSHYFWQHPDKDAVAQEFTVNDGQSFAGVAFDLKDQHLIANVTWFRLMAEVAGLTDNIQAGSFELVPGQNYKTTLAILTAGTTQADIRVTIPEGYTLKQMGETLVAKGLVTADDWSAATGVDSLLEADPFVVAAQKPDTVDLEGYLFPDTYRFSADMGAQAIAQEMLDNMAKHVADGGSADAVSAGLTTHELLTLASILEREVRQPETMKNVADIFLKRLNIGMPLQADSTVNYITGGDDPSISLEDRDATDSPYNTYKYPGLPPGPISAPSDNAIDAVLHPTPNPYLYFLTTKNGDIYYASTNEEQARNKAKYLK